MTCPPSVSETDISDFAATGGNLLRPAFGGSLPLMDKQPPYEINDAAFARLDAIIDQCETHGLRVVVDPHTFPGFRDESTTFPDDAFWQDPTYHALAVELWEHIAQRYRQRGDVIAGYDLLNEPAVTDATARSGPGSWYATALELTAAVRRHDRRHHVLIEPAISPRPSGGPWFSYFEGVSLLPTPPDARIVIEPHMYTPHSFTFQGIGYPSGYTYPGTIPGADWEGLPGTEYWDAQTIGSYLRPALAYQARHGVPIYLGEFSAARWLGSNGNRYLEDCIRWFEAWGWNWSYHSWREFQGWDAELSNTDPNDLTRYGDTPRMRMLTGYYERNTSPADTRKG